MLFVLLLCATTGLPPAQSQSLRHELRGNVVSLLHKTIQPHLQQQTAADDGLDVEGQWGGWMTDPLPKLRFDSSFCNIDVRDELTKEEFQRDYVDKRRPLVLRGKAALACFDGWTTAQHWKRDAFEQRYGSLGMDDGSGKNATVADELRRWRSELDPFHWVSLNMDPVTIAAKHDYRIPELYNATMSTTERPKSQVLVSPPAQGAGWHAHEDAMNALVFGRKRWFLYDNLKVIARDVPGGQGQVDMKTFFTKIYPVVKGTHAAPFECVQHAGEVLYVPTFMYHSTLSIGASIAAGFLRNSPWGVEVDLRVSS